jgi:hypothetical protein
LVIAQKYIVPAAKATPLTADIRTLAKGGGVLTITGIYNIVFHSESSTSGDTLYREPKAPETNYKREVSNLS